MILKVMAGDNNIFVLVIPKKFIFYFEILISNEYLLIFINFIFESIRYLYST